MHSHQLEPHTGSQSSGMEAADSTQNSRLASQRAAPHRRPRKGEKNDIPASANLLSSKTLFFTSLEKWKV